MKTLPAIFVALLLLAALSGCLSSGGGKPRGPVDAFVFTAAANPGLGRDVPGAINMRTDPLEVSVVVPPGTDRSRLAATLALNVEATVTVVSTGARAVQQNGVTRNDFSAPVMYSIEIPKEKKPWRYRVTVREAETNPLLASLAVPEGTGFSPAFNPKTRSYTVEVQFGARQVRIDARGQSQYLKSISFDGAVSAGASASGSVDFSSGQERSVVVETMAEDGVSSERYTILIRRGAPDRNALLSSLEVGEASLAPAFSPQRTEYRAVVPFVAAQVALRAAAQSPYATLALSTIASSGQTQEREQLQVRGGLTDKNGAVLAFAGDWLPLIVTVTAQDGSRREYIVELARAEPDHNNSLASLTVAGFTLQPVFNPGLTSYLLRVPYSTKQLAISAQPQSALSTAALEWANAAQAAAQGTAQGAPPAAGDLASAEGVLVPFQAVDRLTLAVAVTAQDGNTLRYLLDVRRQPPERNADLGSMMPAAGVLTPPFSPRVVTYNLRLPAALEAASLTLGAAGKMATLSTEPPAALSGAVLTAPVAPGQSAVLNILVTAEDGSQKLYRVNVIREGQAPVSSSPEGDSRLAMVQLAGLALSPQFDPAVNTYQAMLPPGLSSVTLSVRAFSPKTLITLDGQPLPASLQPLAVGPEAERVLTLEVKAENGATSRYVIRLLREGAQNPASAGLLVSAKNLKLGAREAAALTAKKEQIAGQAMITVRAYRSEAILSQTAAEVRSRIQGANVTLSLEQQLPALPALAGKMAEVEVSIATSGARFLCYSEARLLEAEPRLDIPFLLLAAKPRVTWPAVGSRVQVAGFLGRPVAEKGIVEREDFEKNDKGEHGLLVEITDAKSGAVLIKQMSWLHPLAGKSKAFALASPIQLPEGAQIAYRLTARARDGKNWQAAGKVQVWTTMLAYEGGFAPVFLQIDDTPKAGK